MKIVYCLNSIRYTGGIQRVTIVKANALAELPGNDVYVVVTDNKGGVLMQPLSAKVHMVDLDVNYYDDDWKSRWNVLKGIFIKRREHRQCLAKALNEIQPDIVVSVGQSEKYLLPEIKGKWKTVRELHFTKTYRRLHAASLFARVLAVLGDMYDYGYRIWRYDSIVLLTNEDKEDNWKQDERLTVIPNPVSFVCGETAALENKRIVTTGRLDEQKNYSSLIRAFRIVADKHPDWVLEIYGDGSLRLKLQQQIADLELDGNVFLKGYTSDVQERMLESSCFVLSSLWEGFGGHPQMSVAGLTK